MGISQNMNPMDIVPSKTFTTDPISYSEALPFTHWANNLEADPKMPHRKKMTEHRACVCVCGCACAVRTCAFLVVCVCVCVCLVVSCVSLRCLTLRCFALRCVVVCYPTLCAGFVCNAQMSVVLCCVLCVLCAEGWVGGSAPGWAGSCSPLSWRYPRSQNGP